MAEIAWEKTDLEKPVTGQQNANRLKFLVGGALILGAVVYLIVSGTLAGSQGQLPVAEVTRENKGEQEDDADDHQNRQNPIEPEERRAVA